MAWHKQIYRRGEIEMIQHGIYDYLKRNYPSELSAYIRRKTPIDYVVDEFSQAEEDQYISSILHKDALFQNYLDMYINDLLSQSPIPLFNKIEIETINRCNNNCAFCPVSVTNEQRQFHSMNNSLFVAIIDQLATLQYHGIVSLFSNNEPLLDSSIIKRLQHIREMLPDAFILLYTNGLLLTRHKLLLLLEYTDFLNINFYTETNELTDEIRAIQAELISKKVMPEKVEIHIRNKFEHLSTRAGNAPNRTHAALLKSKCILPFSQIVVRPDGKVSLCCNDAYGQYTLGDLNQSSLVQVWRSKSFHAIRCQMLRGRQEHPACQKCDMLYMPLAWEAYEYGG